MELEARLRAFAAFVRRRSFSAAAAELRISQPAVSKHVADLERALRARPALRAFMTQASGERVKFADCLRGLATLAREI